MDDVLAVKKLCQRCRQYFEVTAIHCLCPEHDPAKGWWWCSKICRLADHRKKKEGSHNG